MTHYTMGDTGATDFIVSRRLARNLNLRKTTEAAGSVSMDGYVYKYRDFVESFEIHNLNGDFFIKANEGMINDSLTTEHEKPPTNQEIEGLEYLEGVSFSELEDKGIDLIIPVEYLWTWAGEIRRSTQDKPMAVNTHWGWSLVGRKKDQEHLASSCFKFAIQRDNEEITMAK